MSKATATIETNECIVERIKAGDASAMESLWMQNKGLIVYIAKRFNPFLQDRPDLDYEDLRQAGYFGLYAAAQKYNPERGAGFTNYAVFYIKKEIAQALGIRTSKKDIAYRTVSLDEPIYSGDSDTTLGDIQISSDEAITEQVELDELQEAVHAAVGRMKPSVNRNAITEHYFKGTPVKSIAEREDVSRATISARLFSGYSELYNDPTLHEWAVDYDFTSLYRHKGVTSFKSSRSSVVEDIVLQAEERQSKRAALAEVLGSLV